MRRAFGWVLGLYLVLRAIDAATAQTSGEARRLEEKARQSLEPTELAILKKEGRFLLDYGFWMKYLFSDFKNDDNDSTRYFSVGVTSTF